MDNLLISQINLGGILYDLKDAAARADIANLQSAVASGTHYIGKTSTAALVDGYTGSVTIGTGGTVTSLPTTHYQGWTYKVITAGTYAGAACEVGDMIICITDGTSANNGHWTVVQSNVDGIVTGPTSSTANHVVTFNDATGKVVKDSGYTIGKSVPSNAVFTDTTYTSKTAANGGTDVSLVTTGEKYTWNNKQSKVAAKGSTTKPVYTSGSGTFAECSTYAGGTAVTLNGTSKAASTASFYAPTTAGTSGYYLKSNGSGAPTWVTSPSAEDAYSAIRLLFGIGWGGYTVNEVTNAEWQKALLDSENKVVAGIKTDGSFWTAELS